MDRDQLGLKAPGRRRPRVSPMPYGRLLLVALAVAGCAARIIPPSSVPPLAAGEAVATVFLIGDAGAPNPAGEPVLEALSRSLADRADSTVILFIGDNVYPLGLPDSGDRSFRESARRLKAQLAFARQVPVIFVPGNHDWDRSGPEGLARIQRQGRFIARESAGRARLAPADGCPGPEPVDIGPGLRLLLLDTEWWLFPHHKPGEGSACAAHSPAEVTGRLARLLEQSAGRQVIVAAHHPVLSGGPHAGYLSLADHIFPLRVIHPALFLPLPVLGALYPLARSFGISPEDLNSAPYHRLRAALDSVFTCNPPAIYAAGHDHGLQLLDRGRPPLLAVSGAGIYGHEEHLMRIPETRFALSKGGFMRADLLRDGRLRLGVVMATRTGEPREVYAETLPAAGRGDGRCGGGGERTAVSGEK